MFWWKWCWLITTFLCISFGWGRHYSFHCVLPSVILLLSRTRQVGNEIVENCFWHSLAEVSPVFSKVCSKFCSAEKSCCLTKMSASTSYSASLCVKLWGSEVFHHQRLEKFLLSGFPSLILHQIHSINTGLDRPSRNSYQCCPNNFGITFFIILSDAHRSADYYCKLCTI